MKVCIIIEGDSGSDQTHIVSVVDSIEKALDYPDSKDPEHCPRWFEEWEVQ